MLTKKEIYGLNHGFVIERPSEKTKVRVITKMRRHKTCSHCGAVDCSRLIRTENGWDGPIKDECVECYLFLKGKELEEKEFHRAEKQARRKDVLRKMKIDLCSKADFAFNEDLITDHTHKILTDLASKFDSFIEEKGE